MALALAGLFAFTGWGLWKSLIPQPPDTFEMMSTRHSVEDTFSRLPGWLSSMATLMTLFLAGTVSLYLFPKRVKRMQTALTASWRHLFQIMLAGLAFNLLGLALVFAASLARLTFPITLLFGISLFFLSIWGYVTLAYSLGSALFSRAAWKGSPLTALFLGLLLLQPLAHLPYLQVLAILALASTGLGVVITTRFGSNEAWSLNPLLEE
jgi:hypothetical protein